MSRPLLISDCDEVLLHMVVPFRDWLDEAHHIHFDLVHGDWGEALRHKHDGTQVERGHVWNLLNGFFFTEMHRQQPIDGAVEAINRISEHADVVILTNLMDHHNEARGEQLRAVGIDAPVYTNQGGKGEALARIIERYNPSVAVFVDDLGHQHESVGEHLPDVWRLQLVGEPILWQRVQASTSAHARIDLWHEAEQWITEKLLAGSAAPIIQKRIRMIEERLAELGITLPEPAAPVASYVPTAEVGGLLYISGQVSFVDGKLMTGKVGDSRSEEEGILAAQGCGLMLIAQMKKALGSLDRVERIVKLGAFVASTPDYAGQPKVANGASDLMEAVFGDAGKHARSAVGVPVLPLDSTVEIDAVVAVKPA